MYKQQLSTSGSGVRPFLRSVPSKRKSVLHPNLLFWPLYAFLVGSRETISRTEPIVIVPPKAFTIGTLFEVLVIQLNCRRKTTRCSGCCCESITLLLMLLWIYNSVVNAPVLFISMVATRVV